MGRQYTKVCDECGAYKPLVEYPMKFTGHQHQSVCYSCHLARRRNLATSRTPRP